MKLLVVEDSERLQMALEEGFKRSGFTVDIASDGEEALGFLALIEYDVVVLDIMLPKLNGLDVLKHIRLKSYDVRVLLLSAKDEIQDRVKGLELGADDYLIKPFAFEELVARIKTLIRRSHNINQTVLTVGKIQIDTFMQSVECQGKKIELTPTEYKMLHHLVANSGKVLNKAQLENVIYNANDDTISNIIEVLISNIRKKLRAVSVDCPIKTKRGFGYFVDRQ
tara:strand:+ start:21984 stop:22655 length:672 start_codon:yes stop_codon:yes gene_type:complete